MRGIAREALASLRQSGAGALAALRDWLECELENARQEMESADNAMEIWRSQGRCNELRALLSALKQKD